MHERPELLDGELIVPRNIDVLDRTEFEQLLLLGEHLPQEVPIHHLLRRHVELQQPEVLDEVLLGPKAREQLLGHDSALLGAHERLLIHHLLYWLSR